MTSKAMHLCISQGDFLHSVNIGEAMELKGQTAPQVNSHSLLGTMKEGTCFGDLRNGTSVSMMMAFIVHLTQSRIICKGVTVMECLE